MRKEAERREGCIWMLRDIRDCEQPQKAGEGKEGPCPTAWPTTPCMQAPSLQNWEPGIYYDFKPPLFVVICDDGLGRLTQGNPSLSFPVSRGCRHPFLPGPPSIFRVSSDGVNPQVASLQTSVTISMSYQSQEVFSDFKNSRFDSTELSGITQDNRPISQLVAPVTTTKSPCH